MFGIFQKNDMKKALNICQSYYKKIGLGQELTPRQVDIINNMELFRDIESRYRSKGLTNWGGLAWFSAQVVGNTMKNIENGNMPNQTILDLAEKMAYVSIAIANAVPELKLTKSDMGPIESAAQVSIKWIEETATEEDRLLFDKLNKTSLVEI